MAYGEQGPASDALLGEKPVDQAPRLSEALRKSDEQPPALSFGSAVHMHGTFGPAVCMGRRIGTKVHAEAGS